MWSQCWLLHCMNRQTRMDGVPSSGRSQHTQRALVWGTGWHIWGREISLWEDREKGAYLGKVKDEMGTSDSTQTGPDCQDKDSGLYPLVILEAQYFLKTFFDSDLTSLLSLDRFTGWNRGEGEDLIFIECSKYYSRGLTYISSLNLPTNSENYPALLQFYKWDPELVSYPRMFSRWEEPSFTSLMMMSP